MVVASSAATPPTANRDLLQTIPQQEGGCPCKIADEANFVLKFSNIEASPRYITTSARNSLANLTL
jgi:hypothetical protein